MSTLTHQTEAEAVEPTQGETLHSDQHAADESWVSAQTLHTSTEDAPSVGDPMEKLIEQWVTKAAFHARARRIGGEWIADVVGVPGAWAEGTTKANALASLPSVLNEWVRLKLADGDQDIPPMEGLRLVVDA